MTVSAGHSEAQISSVFSLMSLRVHCVGSCPNSQKGRDRKVFTPGCRAQKCHTTLFFHVLSMELSLMPYQAARETGKCKMTG